MIFEALDEPQLKISLSFLDNLKN